MRRKKKKGKLRKILRGKLWREYNKEFDPQKEDYSGPNRAIRRQGFLYGTNEENETNID